jgi:hypothetical protein
MMLAALLLALAQEDVTILFGDADRSTYEKHLAACERARQAIETDPARAVEDLTQVLAMEADLKVKTRPVAFERRVRTQPRATEYGSLMDFYPFQFRGRARINLARNAPPAKARQLLGEAVSDLEASVERQNRTSEPYLKTAREALWASLQAALAFEAWSPAERDVGPAARTLLGAIARHGIPQATVDWLAAEAARAAGKVAALKRDREQPEARQQAPRVAEWCRTVASAVKGLQALEAVDRQLNSLAKEADAVAAFKGFRLKIAVSPYAEGVRLLREGVEVSLPRDYTPLAVAAVLDAGRYEVVLRHPKWGERRHAIGVDELEEGKVHVLTGDMESGKFRVTRLP